MPVRECFHCERPRTASLLTKVLTSPELVDGSTLIGCRCDSDSDQVCVAGTTTTVSCLVYLAAICVLVFSSLNSSFPPRVGPTPRASSKTPPRSICAQGTVPYVRPPRISGPLTPAKLTSSLPLHTTVSYAVFANTINCIVMMEAYFAPELQAIQLIAQNVTHNV